MDLNFLPRFTPLSVSLLLVWTLFQRERLSCTFVFDFDLTSSFALVVMMISHQIIYLYVH